MKQILKMTAAPAALLAFALTGTTAAEARPGEYCRTDVTSGMRRCSFSTMEECQAMSSGRGGSCFRDPFLEDSSAYAYQPKTGNVTSRSRSRTGKTPQFSFRPYQAIQKNDWIAWFKK